ncbi:MAG: hypothetical protein RLZZ546_2414 [Bacteroidota bacterium]|jgi:hypothetical protein
MIIKNTNPYNTFTEKEELFPGVWVYRNVFKKEMDIINRLETTLENSKKVYGWKEARVGYRQHLKDYRDCYDFKYQKLDIFNKDKYMIELDKIWQDCYDTQITAVNDYCSMYTISMQYWEAMNFIKYGPGQHFQEHSDHGFSYVASVSLVGYLNDDYEGGNLFFTKIGLDVKPQAGDLYIFPSDYLFSHIAQPVTTGTKYSVVTMLDYNDKFHTPESHKGLV